ncbi:MAG: hypothetical protein RIB59_03155 [Rhodospirillales bacterium]
MDTTIARDATAEPPLPPQERLGRPGIRQAGPKAPGGAGIERRLNLHSVHILAIEAVVAAMPKGNGIDAARVYAYIDERAGETNANLGASAKKVAAELMQSAGTAGTAGTWGILPQTEMMKRAASWVIAIGGAIAIVTAGFVGIAALVIKGGFGG